MLERQTIRRGNTFRFDFLEVGFIMFDLVPDRKHIVMDW